MPIGQTGSHGLLAAPIQRITTMKKKPERQQRRRGIGHCGAAAAAALSLTATAAAETPLPPIVLESLDLALADERLALATYDTVLRRFGDIRPFVNIAQAEQRHIEALLAVYARYGIPVPQAEPQVDPATLTLDITGLCRIGVMGEIENVRLYDEQLLPAVADYPDISSVLRALRDASAYNHLPAFERCVSRTRHHVQTET
jgi:hypothetical protein